MGAGAGAGGAVTIDLPMIQFKTSSPSSSPSLPSSSSSCCSSSDSSSPKFPVPVNKSVSLRQSCTVASSRCSIGSGSRIDCVHGEEDKRPGGSLFDAILRQVPSRFEVESAIAALRDFVEGIPSLGVEFHWLLRILYSSVSVLQAFRSLETEPSVKRLVISLATDKAVWDAILNNEMVRTLRDSGNTAGFWRLPNYVEEPDISSNKTVRKLEDSGNTAGRWRLPNPDEERDLIASMLNWVMEIIRVKIDGLMQQFQLLMDQIFRPTGRDNPTKVTRDVDEVDEKVRSSFLLSIVILVIVVVTRANLAF